LRRRRNESLFHPKILVFGSDVELGSQGFLRVACGGGGVVACLTGRNKTMSNAGEPALLII